MDFREAESLSACSRDKWPFRGSQAAPGSGARRSNAAALPL